MNLYDLLGLMEVMSFTDSTPEESDIEILLESDIDIDIDDEHSDEFGIVDVIYNAPATIVMWDDGSKTVVRCQDGDIYNPETGLAMCIIKRIFGNDGSYNELFKRWLP